MPEGIGRRANSAVARPAETGWGGLGVWRATPSRGALTSDARLVGRRGVGASCRDRLGGQAMEIERTTFGTITIDGKIYEHDVIVRLSGEVERRKKKLSKKYYGTSHVLSKEEAKFVFENGCQQLILGTGQMGNVHLSPEAEAYFAKKGCTVLLQPTPRAIHTFNNSHAKKIGLFHVTC
jgi:hypothetical protein